MAGHERIESALLRTRTATSDCGAVVEGSRRFEHVELARWATHFAGELAREGIRPGDRVAIQLDHVVESIVAIYGAWIAGAIAVPINQMLKSSQVAHIVSHSGSRVFVSALRNLAALDQATLAGVRTLQVLACPTASAESSRIELLGGDLPAAILYTSGSTGRPKGILVSHANLLAGTRIVAGYLGLRADDRILSVLPFSFDYGLNQLLTSVQCGCTLVLQRSHFPGDILASLAAQRITGLAGVPSLWIQLVSGATRRLDLPHLRYLTNSGGVFPVALVERYRLELPDTRIFLMYGLSEAFRSTYLAPKELVRRPGSIGKAIPETEVLVVGELGEVCAAGTRGELVHRGPTVALGYWNDSEATARVFRPDPDAPNSNRKVVFSGDLVERDADGFLYFVGRRDQQLKSYGYRVSPDEVEESIQASKLVTEVAVNGRKDELSGDAIVAHVIPLDPRSFRSSTLLEFCRARLPAYMVPKFVVVHDSLPRTSSGKIDRKALAS